ncbi:class I SAM-dependent methyltransferase [Aliarcobacter trophiarum]|uniref:class I SAM-dependent methyltransferase n=1 Tax=Aliarcobacter trophiarum TaxID=708186 RepID=UPI00100AB489|nr:class I SAM-dependent methyltransferase [Aliarcobacter trophiarum]RXI28247.1 SAM-dependent methyltransferase [Aliarcobacter trophiarum]
MNNGFFKNAEKLTTLEALYEASKIAFAPIVFQVARALRDLKILEILIENRDGLTIEELANKSELSIYAIKVLGETAISSNILYEKDNKLYISKVGIFINSDEMTKINMNYNHYVNYLGLYNLEESIKNKKPEGLKVFGDWETIYPALSSLPKKVQDSWFEFDHFYSDSGFPTAIEYLKNLNIKTILDIGGNTGKFAMELSKKYPKIDITIMDLPQQIKLAKKNIYEKNLTNISFLEANVLLDTLKDIASFDTIWMSQFLDCFEDEQIEMILQKIKSSKNKDAQICIMEPFWDRQNNEIASFCVINTSPYFTAMANGYSKMFRYSDFEKILKKLNFEILEVVDNIGLCQSIIRIK